MSGEAALPRLELPKQPYRSRYYRDNVFGRLAGKPKTIISQKNVNTSTILNNFLAGLDNINNSGSRLDSTSQFEVQFSKEKNPVKESSKDLQGKKRSLAKSQLQLHENNQSCHVEESFADKRKEKNGYCSSSKQMGPQLVPLSVDDKASVRGGGDGERDYIDEADEPLLIAVKTLMPEDDMSPMEKFGITYNAEASVINSTPNVSCLSHDPKPKMRLCFNSITPVVRRNPLAAIKEKNIVSSVEKHKTSVNYFGKKPVISVIPPPAQVAPSISAPKCNEFELMENESFSFESQIVIPRKSQKPNKQENTCASDIKEVIKKGKHNKTAEKEVATTDAKQDTLLSEPMPVLTQLGDKETSKVNKPTKLEEAGKRSSELPLRNNMEEFQEELQNEPPSTSKQPLTPKQKTKLEPVNQRSGKKYASIEGNGDECETLQEQPPSRVVEKTKGMEMCKISKQGAVNSKNAAKSDSLANLSKAVASNRKRISYTESDIPNKNKVVSQPMSSDYNSLTKCVDPVSVPLTEVTADDQEAEKLAGLETNKLKASLLSGKNKEATILSASQTISRLPQRIHSKGPTLSTSKTPAVFSSKGANNKQKECPTENAVPSTSAIGKQKKEQALSFPNKFGIKPAVSALPHLKEDIHLPSSPNREFEFEFELEEEKSFCFESWITIPKKAKIQDLAEQKNKSVSAAKKTRKKERVQKTESTRKEVIVSLIQRDDEKELALNKNKRSEIENQPKGSGEKSTCLLKYNKTVNTEKEKQEIQNESLLIPKCLLSPKQKRIGSKERGRKNIVTESDKAERQGELREDLHVNNENRTEKSRLSEKDLITCKKLPKSKSSVNLPSSHPKHLAPKQTESEKIPRRRPRKKPVIAEGQEELREDFCVEDDENRTEKSHLSEQDTASSERLSEPESLPQLPIDKKISKLPSFSKPQTQNKKKTKRERKQKSAVIKKEMSLKETQPKKSCSKKYLPYRFDENIPQGNAVNVYTRSKRPSRPPPKWWVVQQDNDHPQNRLKTDNSTELDDSVQEQTAKPFKSQTNKGLKGRASHAQAKPLRSDTSTSEGQRFENVFENDSSPSSSPHTQSKPKGQHGAVSQHGNSERLSHPQSKPIAKRGIGNQQEDDSDSLLVKEQGKKQKYSAQSIPKKRLFSEVEEEKGKPFDMHLPKKQKSKLKLKVHNFDMQDQNKMQGEEYSPLSRPAYVCTTSRQTQDYIDLPSKPFRESVASLLAAHVDEKIPQTVKISSEIKNQAVTSPRKSFTKSAHGANAQAFSGNPNQTVMRLRKRKTTKYQDETVPSQHFEQPTDVSEENNKPGPSSSVQRERTLKQRLSHNLPVFNSSGPGPCRNYEGLFDEDGVGYLDHRETMENNEKEPSEEAIQESLKSTCVWSVKENSEVFIDCVTTSDMCDFFYPLKTEYEDNRSIAICKSLNWQTFSCGKLVLGPYKEKGCQMVYKDTMVFHILKGELGITIYRTTYHLKEGDYFFVPSGNTYNVTNLQDTEAVLFFTQLKGGKMK
ncbi:uncharacterized protein LOC144494790 isoform X2 [Mustelus asterias]